MLFAQEFPCLSPKRIAEAVSRFLGGDVNDKKRNQVLVDGLYREYSSYRQTMNDTKNLIDTTVKGFAVVAATLRKLLLDHRAAALFDEEATRHSLLAAL